MTDTKGSGNRPSRKQAVALRYDQEKGDAPILVGKGAGAIAQKILALAEEHGIPIHEDSDLVEVLSRLDLQEEIPASTYLAVAEILAFIYRTNEKYK